MTVPVFELIRAHQANIRRYKNILATALDEPERLYLERRLADELQALQTVTDIGTQSKARPADFSRLEIIGR